jgi:5-methylcytosine-specific restriction endonuclease McrA
MALKKPCVVCGRPSGGSRCPAHTIRTGSTRNWRRVRAQVLHRDEHECVLCGAPGSEVDHVVQLVEGGSDHPANLRTLCHDCHAGR